VLPANRDLNASMEGDMSTSAGNWFNTRTVAKKEAVDESVDAPSWNTEFTNLQKCTQIYTNVSQN